MLVLHYVELIDERALCLGIDPDFEIASGEIPGRNLHGEYLVVFTTE